MKWRSVRMKRTLREPQVSSVPEMYNYILKKENSSYCVKYIPAGRTTYIKWRTQYKMKKGFRCTSTQILVHFKVFCKIIKIVVQQNVKEIIQHYH